jgi:hypothetical protein
MTPKRIKLTLRVIDSETMAELLKLKEGSERELFALNALRLGIRSMRGQAVAPRLVASPPKRAAMSAAEVLAVYPDLVDLSGPLALWLRDRMNDRRLDWPYHPRSNDLSDFVRRQVMRDLLRACPAFAADAVEGRVACDLNVRLVGHTGQGRKLDLVLGAPASGRLARESSSDPLRKAKLALPTFSLEVKACMTAHAKAIPRLIGELQQSIEVVKTTNASALAFAVLVVNVSRKFTSPLNRPGPNVHDQPRAAKAVIDATLRRIPIGPRGYSAVAIVLIDFDNERNSRALAPTAWIPASHRYVNALISIATTYRSPSP